MATKFVNTIVFVCNLQESQDFYAKFLGLKVDRGLEKIVFFENGLVLHCAKSASEMVLGRAGTNEASQGNNNLLIYIECASFDELQMLYSRVRSEVRIIHEVKRQSWGQRVFRFYDPDGHIVECGEPQTEKVM